MSGAEGVVLDKDAEIRYASMVIEVREPRLEGDKILVHMSDDDPVRSHTLTLKELHAVLARSAVNVGVQAYDGPGR